MLDFPVAPVLLGYALGPPVEDNFRGSMLLAHGDWAIFFRERISLVFVLISRTLLVVQFALGVLGMLRKLGGSMPSGEPLLDDVSDVE